MHSVEISFLNSDCLLTSSVTQHLYFPFVSPIGTKIGDLVQYMTVGQLSFPLVSSVSALFTRDTYYIARPCYGFLSCLPSVRPSVSGKVCPRRRAVSLRQLSFLFSAGTAFHQLRLLEMRLMNSMLFGLLIMIVTFLAFFYFSNWLCE